jgi:DNA helicase-2/ATP-dependent DNA helicase PcrA
MAAKRLNFEALYTALNVRKPAGFSQGLRDGSLWVFRPFLSYVLPLVDAVCTGRDFEIMDLLRKHSPLMAEERLAREDVPMLLRRVENDVTQLAAMFRDESTSTIGEVLKFIADRELADVDERFEWYLEQIKSQPTQDHDEEGNALSNFLSCKASELLGYRRYIEDESAFATHQGVKGAEFDRVLVVLDEEEGNHRQFSYEKLLNIKPLSQTDEKNLRTGKESVLERTRRLFYVCCSRAKKDLAVVLFVSDVSTAKKAVLGSEIFPRDDIHDLADLGGIGSEVTVT